MALNDYVSAVDVIKLDGASIVVGTPTVTVLKVDSAMNVLLAKGATLPTDGDAGYAMGSIFIYTAGGIGTTLYMNEGSATSADFNAITTSAGSGVTTWDQLYDLDKSLTIDDTTLTFALTHVTSDGVTFTGDAASAGDVIKIQNAGSGMDLSGTSDTWSFSKAGALLVKTIAHPTTDTALTIDGNGTGKVTIAGTSTGNIELQQNVTMPASKTITMTGVGGSDEFTLTAGDMVLSDGSLTITDADNAATITLTNNTITTATALVNITSTSLTTGAGILMTANGLTEGAMLKLVTTSAGLTTGAFISVNDGSERFSVKADGATAIVGGVNSTVGLKVTGIQTAEDMVELTSSGVTASGQGVLLINSSGNSADGSAQIRIAPSGTPVEGAMAIQVVGGGGKVIQGLNIDTDTATNSANLINGGGAIATNKAVLELTSDGTPANTASSVFRVAFTGTATNKPRLATFVGTGKDAGGIYLDTDNTTTHGVSITGTGALNAGRMLFVGNDSTPGASTDFIAEISFTGTATNTPGLLKLMGDTKNVNAITIDTDNVGVHSVSISGAGALASGRMLYVTNTGTPAAATDAVAELTFTGTATNNPIVLSVNNGTANALPLLVTSNVASATREVAKFVQDSTTGANEVLHLQQDDIDQAFIHLTTTVGTGNAIEAIASKSLTTTHFVMVNIEGVGARYFPVGTIA